MNKQKVSTYLIIFTIFFLTQFKNLNIETLEWDISTYLVMGQDIVRGNLPYEFQWSVKPPLIYFIFGFFSFLSGGDYLIIKILDKLVILFSSLFIYKIVERNNNYFAGLISSLIYLVFMENDYLGQVGYSEIYSSFFLLLAINYDHSEKNKKILIGLFLGLMTLVNTGSVVLFLSYLILNVKKSLKNFYMIGLGFSIPHLIFMFIYFLNGILKSYLVSMIVMPLAYAGSNFEDESGFIKSFIDKVLLENIFLGFLIILLIFGILLSFRTQKKYINDLSLILLIAGLIYPFLANKGYVHHWIFFITILCLNILNVKKISFFKLVFIMTLISFINISYDASFRSLNNLRNIDSLKDNYPVYQISLILKNQVGIEESSILSLDGHLILFYLDKQNLSYHVHPRNRIFDQFNEPLIKYDMLKENEIDYILSQKPEIIVCSEFSNLHFIDCESLKDYKLLEQDYIQSIKVVYKN
tara:strand:- start:786 stop:2192 length:1407 start_codon:yes stop_codon:yes gene_type:complete